MKNSQLAIEHAQRVLRLRREFSSRFQKYTGRPDIGPALKKLMLLDKGADNSLSTEELDSLDAILEPIHKLRAAWSQNRLHRP